MQWFKQSTAASLVVGPILDSTGAEYASAVIGDLSISKNGGTLTALASAATLTYIANGYYTLALTTGNTDTLGRADISCNKATYQMPPRELMVLPATVYDALTTNAVGAAGGFLLCGANAGAVSFTNGITVTQGTLNGSGLSITGNGTGAGILATGGDTGIGISAVGGASGAGTADGIRATAVGGRGVYANGAAAGLSCAATDVAAPGILATGNTSGPGVRIVAGSTGAGVTVTTTSGDGISVTPTAGNGITVTANGTSKHGIVVTGGTGGTSDGLKAVAGTGGVPIRGDITGNLVGTVSTLTTYTGNTPQTGDSFARIGATGSGLTSLAPSSTALSTAVWTAPPAGFLAATFPAAVASPTNITAGTITTVGTVTNLTNLPTAPTDWVTAAAVSAAAVTKIQAGLSTYAGGDTAGTTTLLTRVTAAVALAGSAPSWYSAPVDVSANVTAIKAKTDNLPAAPAATGDIPTATANADALLGRNVAGGSSTGRTVSQALFALRNKVDMVTGTVYGVDDSTPAWTFTTTSDAAADPITVFDPA